MQQLHELLAAPKLSDVLVAFIWQMSKRIILLMRRYCTEAQRVQRVFEALNLQVSGMQQEVIEMPGPQNSWRRLTHATEINLCYSVSSIKRVLSGPS